MTDGSTLRFALLGSPVHHSASPTMHAAAFASMGLRHRYDAVACDLAGVKAALEMLRRGAFSGLNITAPYKEAIVPLLDAVEPTVERTRSCNTVAFRDGKTVGYNTDVPALEEEFQRLAPHATRAVVLGAGATARSAVLALRRRGVHTIVVTTRSWTTGEALLSDRAERFRALDAMVTLWPSADPRASSKLSFAMRQTWSETVANADIVVQATSGRDETVARAIPWRNVRPQAVAYDVAYEQLTPFLRRARDAGLVASSGIRMLVAQGALSQRIWLNIDPPRDAMLSAVIAKFGDV